jgi:signal peptidase I
VEVAEGKVFINDQLLSEPYLATESATLLKDGRICLSVTLKDDEYFLLGDNRAESHDSREDGAVRRESVLSYLRYETINSNLAYPDLVSGIAPSCTGFDK